MSCRQGAPATWSDMGRWFLPKVDMTPDVGAHLATTTRYAVVVVNAVVTRRITSEQPDDTDDDDLNRLSRAFHYLVVPGQEVQPGQLVWVPFRTRTLQGVIIALDDSAPVDYVRPLLRIADPEPVLDVPHLQLARWISEYYLAPLHQVIAAMLPQGVLQPVDTVIRLEKIPVDAVSDPQQQALLDILQEKGALSLSRLRKLRPSANWRSTLEQMVRKGWLSRSSEALPPVVNPRTVPFVRLSSSEQPRLRAGTRQEIAIRFLREHPNDSIRLDQASAESGVGPEVFRALAARGIVEIETREVWRDPLAGQTFYREEPPELTPEQTQVWQFIERGLLQREKPILLQGVTGSGKTEIYLRAAARVLEQGRGAIVLVPEISLTPQTIRRFGARFGETLAVLHSQLSPGERYDQWRRIRAGELRLVVGARSALFAPVKDIGLVVLDEEHEWTYKQESTPRYHARETAVRLCELAGASCILGSATPSMESAYRVELGAYVRLSLPNRIVSNRQQSGTLHNEIPAGGANHQVPNQPGILEAELPPVRVVDMRAELRDGHTHMFSRPLQQALTQVLANREQAILFLNRRGSATFVLCRDCGFVLDCPQCKRSLTYHDAQTSLTCHQCGYRQPNVSICPRCRSKRIRYFGAGTEKVEEAARELYPQARIVRWDLDTTSAKGDHERILEQFTRGKADIMVGTQMVAKGLDLPLVTLVGVVSADTMLYLPDFRSSERTFQLLVQVAGRAGRSALGGQVIVQTYNPESPAIQAASRHDVDGFYAQEIAFRREEWYPPASRLVALRYTGAGLLNVQHEASAMAERLRQRRARLGIPEIDILGSAPCFYAMRKGKYRWQIILRGTDPTLLIRDINLPVGWQVDVDPISLL